MYTIVLPGGKIATIFVKLDPKHQVCKIPSPVQANISFPAEVVGRAHFQDFVKLLICEYYRNYQSSHWMSGSLSTRLLCYQCALLVQVPTSKLPWFST